MIVTSDTIGSISKHCGKQTHALSRSEYCLEQVFETASIRLLSYNYGFSLYSCSAFFLSRWITHQSCSDCAVDTYHIGRLSVAFVALPLYTSNCISVDARYEDLVSVEAAKLWNDGE